MEPTRAPVRCCSAQRWRWSGRPIARRLPRGPGWACCSTVWACWRSIGLIAAYALVHEQHPLLYRGGLSLVAVGTAIALAATTHPAARWLPRLLELPPLRWIGLRSYGIYLWHWPIFMVTRPGVDLSIRPMAGCKRCVLPWRWHWRRFPIGLSKRRFALARLAASGMRCGRPGADRSLQVPLRRRWSPGASCLAHGSGATGVGRRPWPPAR